MKWHVGEAEGRLPIDQGFDEWFGIKNTSDESGYSSYPLFAESGFPVPKIWEGVKGSEARPVDDFDIQTRPLMDEKIAGRTVEFIQRNSAAEKPFFVYVGFTQMHPPLIHHPDFKGKSGGGTYSDTLVELDHRTGQILDPIDAAGIADNTIVVWSSDNRDHVLFYGSHGGIMSVKWKTMNVVFRYAESTSGPIIKPQWPLVFDLIDDPTEEWGLIEKRMDCAWVMAPVAQRIGALAKSTATYPNIQPGQEFEGYK